MVRDELCEEALAHSDIKACSIWTGYGSSLVWRIFWVVVQKDLPAMIQFDGVAHV